MIEQAIWLTAQRRRDILSRMDSPRWGMLLDQQDQGPDGFRARFGERVRGHREHRYSVIVTAFESEPARTWVHASISSPKRMPTYNDLDSLHRAVFGEGYAYQVFVGGDKHVNLHPYCLHLWGRADGTPALPDFGQFGMI